MVHRNHLCVLLKRGAYSAAAPSVVGAALATVTDCGGLTPTSQRSGRGTPRGRPAPLVTWQELEATYPRYPSAEDIVLSQADRWGWRGRGGWGWGTCRRDCTLLLGGGSDDSGVGVCELEMFGEGGLLCV